MEDVKHTRALKKHRRALVPVAASFYNCVKTHEQNNNRNNLHIGWLWNSHLHWYHSELERFGDKFIVFDNPRYACSKDALASDVRSMRNAFLTLAGMRISTPLSPASALEWQLIQGHGRKMPSQNKHTSQRYYAGIITEFHLKRSGGCNNVLLTTHYPVLLVGSAAARLQH